MKPSILGAAFAFAILFVPASAFAQAETASSDQPGWRVRMAQAQLRPFDRCVANCMERHCPQQTAEKWVCAKRVRSSCVAGCRR